jgi:hypothetical protein
LNKCCVIATSDALEKLCIKIGFVSKPYSSIQTKEQLKIILKEKEEDVYKIHFLLLLIESKS